MNVSAKFMVAKRKLVLVGVAAMTTVPVVTSIGLENCAINDKMLKSNSKIKRASGGLFMSDGGAGAVSYF